MSRQQNWWTLKMTSLRLYEVFLNHQSQDFGRDTLRKKREELQMHVRERPLARVGRASVKPRREVTSSSRRETNLADVIQPVMSGGLDPLQQDSSCMSVGSATSLLSDRSDDSGYASTSSEMDSSSPKSGNKRSFGLASFFRRKERSLHELHSGATSISTRSVTPLLEETPEAEPTTG